MDFKAIQELLRFVSKSDLTEVELEQGDFKLKIKRKGLGEAVEYVPMAVTPTYTSAPVAMPAPSAGAAEPAGDAMPAAPRPVEAAPAAANLHTIKSPMIGTFYRSAGPDKPAFVNVGDSINAGQTICIVEAMKLFNEIESEVAGRIVKILVENAQPVEYDQPLFVVELSK